MFAGSKPVVFTACMPQAKTQPAWLTGFAVGFQEFAPEIRIRMMLSITFTGFKFTVARVDKNGDVFLDAPFQQAVQFLIKLTACSLRLAPKRE